jgi:hypothetical protein
VLTALLEAPALVLLVSRGLRQSGELYRKVLDMYRALGQPVAITQKSVESLELANGSRIVCLPGSEENVRSYSAVKLLVIDEAARVPDELYKAVRPMLAVSGGRLMALSTPFGKRGWFFNEWMGEGSEWGERVKISATDCPRIAPEFLAEEERSQGPHWFAQEYGCSFEDTIDSVFAYEDIVAAFARADVPLVVFPS